jgi:hypothetical protein
MTPLPVVPNVIEIGLHWTIDEDSNSVTKLHYHTPTANPSAADLQALAGSLQTNAVTPITNLCSNHVKLSQISCTELGSGLQNVGSVAPNATGQHSGGFLPANAAMLVNYQIGRRYRGGKPRSYFPFGSTVDLTDAQSWNLAGSTNWPNVLTTMFSAIKGATGGAITLDQQVSVSYYSGQLLAQNHRGETVYVSQRRQTPLVDNILGFKVSPKIASQRRRMAR